jgi:deazaflavin-dependent oxidoreductase (nitroreductase family)
VKPHGNSIAILTHFGRRSGKPYHVQIWWVELDGQVWIGSLDTTRAWVRNIRATGRALLDRGRGSEAIRCDPVESASEIARFARAIRDKYPILGRLLPLLFERERCAFRTRPDDTASVP